MHLREGGVKALSRSDVFPVDAPESAEKNAPTSKERPILGGAVGGGSEVTSEGGEALSYSVMASSTGQWSLP
jgi:hypothetical protein